jgi:hypothetical protein
MKSDRNDRGIDRGIELHKHLKASQIERARRGILAFTLWTMPEFQVNWHHSNLARKLNAFVRGEIRFLMVFMPPRHGKSEMVSRRLPAFIHGQYPDAEIMAVSYLDALAADMTTATQAIIDSAAYRELFPATRISPPSTLYTKGTRNSSEHHIIGRKGKYRGQGVGGSFTGKGANFIIIDDPIKGREIADSVAFRERLWNFWENDLFTRLETDLVTGRKGQVLITLTRWHEDDLAGRLIEKMKKDPRAIQWDVISYPAMKVNHEDPTDPRQLGDPLWPKKYDLDQLNQIRAGGVRVWTSLYQQNPTPDGGSMFKNTMFKFEAIPPEFDYRFITADTSYKEKKENDPTVFSSWGVVGEQLHLIDIWHNWIKAVDVEDAVVPFIEGNINYGYRHTWIEPQGHGIYLNQKFALKDFHIPNEEELKEFYKDRRLDKVQRANNVLPHLSHRYVVINKDIINRATGLQVPTKEELVAECLSFPNTKHDDFVDTLIDALKIVYGKVDGSLFDLY